MLETGCVYIVPLLESLALPADIAAAANPKSSTGRLDVFTRVIADDARGFDRIEAGYHGPLYVEISPRTFPVLVREGSRLSQIRFRRGHALLDAAALAALHARERLVDDRRRRRRRAASRVSVDLAGFGPGRPHRLPRQAPHRPDRRRPARRLRRRRFLGADRARAADREPDPRSRTSSTSSPRKEAVQVPPDYAAEMVPFDPLVGEFRVHYAGFFDPGFGYAGAGGAGAAPCSRCARARCRSSSSTARSSAAWSTSSMLARPDALYGAGHRLELPGARA